MDMVAVMEPQTLLSFQHKSLQDFASSKHLAKRLDKAMKEGKCTKVILVFRSRVLLSPGQGSTATCTLECKF